MYIHIHIYTYIHVNVMLYPIILYYTILCYVPVYHIMIYYIILYYLHGSVPDAAPRPARWRSPSCSTRAPSRAALSATSEDISRAPFPLTSTTSVRGTLSDNE